MSKFLAWAFHQPVPTSARLTLMSLADCADAKGTASPPVTMVCELAGLSDRAVRQAIGELEANGLITVERNPPQRSVVRLMTEIALKPGQWRTGPKGSHPAQSAPDAGSNRVDTPLWTPSWVDCPETDPENHARFPPSPNSPQQPPKSDAGGRQGDTPAEGVAPPPDSAPSEPPGRRFHLSDPDQGAGFSPPFAGLTLHRLQGRTLQIEAYPASGAGPCTGVLCLTVPKKGTRKASTKNTQVARGGDPAGFAGFYDRYPRKVGRRAAIRAWLAATQRGATLSMLLAALDGQRLELRERRFIPHPATWLNRDGWLDEPDRPDDGPRLDPRNLTGFAALAYRAQREAEEHREQAVIAS